MTQAAHTASAIELDGKDLPAYCPNPAMPAWSSHPRVFLEMSHGGEAKCPYCGTVYRMRTDVAGVPVAPARVVRR